MAHINSLGAGMFSDLSISTPLADPAPGVLAALNSAAGFAPLFATEISSVGGTKAPGTFVRIQNVREFPALGTPANVVNVPVFGSAISRQVQGQADAPSMELNINFVASEWAKEVGNILGNMVGDGKIYAFRFALLNAEPTLTTTAKYASTVPGLGSVQNSHWYWVGKVEALQVSPQLTDANTATVTLTIQSAFYGAFTI